MNCKLSNFFLYFILFLFFLVIFNFSNNYVSIFGDQLIKNNTISLRIKNPIDAPLPYLSGRNDLIKNATIYNTGLNVKINCDGSKKEILSEQCLISNLIERSGIILSKLDEVNPKITEEIKDNLIITIKRILYKEYIKETPIKFKTIYEQNPIVEKGLTVVWEPGEEGKLKSFIKDKFEDGKFLKREIIWERIEKHPIDEIMAIGTAEFDYKFKKKIRMLASSYNPTVEQCGEYPFITYTGKRVKYGYVAVDPKYIPLGTKLYVSGYGYSVAEDTGGLIKKNRIDLFFWRRCPEWRGGYIDVYILE